MNQPMLSRNVRLQGKVALVTGAGGGIGEATAALFAEEGAALALFDRDKHDVSDVADSLGGANRRVVPWVVDVGSESEVARAVEEVHHEFGRIDVLVNAAAVRIPVAPITELTAEDWLAVLNVNLLGAAHCSKYAARAMERGGGGSIVHVSSIGAYGARHGWAPYDASKAALLSLTRDMACDLAPMNIRVNAVCPGHTLTKFHVRNLARAEGLPYGEAETRLRATGAANLMRRQAEPREIAAAILFLASDEASFVNAASFRIDGGVADEFRDNVPAPLATPTAAGGSA